MTEPGADLALAIAVASAVKAKPVPKGLVILARSDSPGRFDGLPG